MYENKKAPLISTQRFKKRMLMHIFAAFILIVIALVVGITGHVYFNGMDISSALVASMTITSGLGMSILPDTMSGKVFASLYGIFSGYVYVATSGIVMAPILHRILHKLHLDD